MRERGSVLVVGGGLAGLSAACRLADAGYGVTVLEKRPFLGGRAYSYMDGRAGLEVDNGQHVFLGCCEEYISFLRSLGVFERTFLQRRLHLRVIDKLTGRSVLRGGTLPKPFHLMPSFLRYRPLSLKEKLLAVYALARLSSLKPSDDSELDSLTFAQWLRGQGQDEHAIRNFWNLIILPTLNEDIEVASAELAVMVLREGFLRSRHGSAIGYAQVGLSRLLADSAAEYIRSRGGDVRPSEAAEGLLIGDGRITCVATKEGTLTADSYLLAVPHDGVHSLLPLTVREDDFFGRIGRIESSPIVNIHLWYDRPVVNIDFAAFLNTPMQWLFNKTKLWEQPDGGGQYIDISLSGAHDFIDVPGQELIELFTREVQAFFPNARTAGLRNTLVVKQPGATFKPRPGIRRLRPNQRTPIANLFLAGDWTDTGWPATMESAVRSGNLAAQAIIERASKGVREEQMAVAGGIRN